MKVRTPLFLAVVSALAALLLVPAYGETGVLWIVVRDRDTHQPIAAKVRIEGPESLSTQTDENGKLRLSLPTGQYQVDVSAPRYLAATWRTTLWNNPGDVMPHDIMMFHAFADAPVHGQTGELTITVRDVWTQLAVRAKIEIEGPKSLSTETDENGSLKLSLPTGDDYLIQISAPGYKIFVWDALMIRPGENASGAMLDPIREPERPPLMKSLEAQLRPGYALVDGRAVDEQGHPVADVRVTLRGKGIETIETTTDNKGYFGFLVPTPPGTPDPDDPREILPGTGEVTIAKSGYKTQIHHSVPLIDNSNWGVSFVEMERGSGVVESDDAPAWLNGTAGTCIGEGACDFDDTPEHLKVKPEKPSPASPIDSPRPW